MIISVITVVYNAEKAIEKTILSVLKQKENGHVEYILVDGGSEDKTVDIIRQYEEGIDLWISKPDNGIYDAMNKGIDIATGEWILFLNAGDVFYGKTVLYEICKNADQETHVIYGDTIVDYGSFMILRKAGDLRKMWKGLPYYHQSMLVRTNLMKENLFNTKYRIGADFDFVYKLLNAGYNFYNYTQPISIYDAFGISNRNIIRSFMEYLKISREIKPLTFKKNTLAGCYIAYYSLISITRFLLPKSIFLKMILLINKRYIV